jgi:hypothetical protein
MRLLATLLSIALLLLGLSSAALAETNVKVKVKEAKPKTVVKSVTRVRAPGDIVAFSTDADKTVKVLPLDAPDNPYVKVYTDWDRWVLENARPDIRFSDLHWVDGRWVYTDPDKGDLDVVVAQVNPKGYLLPVGDKTVLNVGPQVPLLRRAANNGNYYVIAAGTAAPEVRKVYVRERTKVIASVAPPVPDWIIKQPGQHVIFTPDKDFIVERNNIWVRYDPAGKVIAQTKPGESWRVLFWPKYSEVVTTAPAKKWSVLDDSGYVVVRDAGGKIVSVYDYDGTPLKVEDVKVDRQPFYYTPLDWDTVLDLHNAQVGVEADGDVKVKVVP